MKNSSSDNLGPSELTATYHQLLTECILANDRWGIRPEQSRIDHFLAHSSGLRRTSISTLQLHVLLTAYLDLNPNELNKERVSSSETELLSEGFSEQELQERLRVERNRLGSAIRQAETKRRRLADAEKVVADQPIPRKVEELNEEYASRYAREKAANTVKANKIRAQNKIDSKERREGAWFFIKTVIFVIIFATVVAISEPSCEAVIEPREYEYESPRSRRY